MVTKNLAAGLKTYELFLGLLILFLLAGCSVALDKTIVMPQAPIPESRKVTVAVLPFEHVVPEPDPEERRTPKTTEPENPELQKFERQYFPARLAQTLKQSPWVKESYVTPGVTPSVDYVVRGDITESDGEITGISVTVARCCWTDVFTKQFRIDLSSGDFKDSSDPAQTLWNSIANEVGRYFNGVTAEDSATLASARAAMYAQQGEAKITLTPKSSATIVKAAQWERENLLHRISTMASSFESEVTPTYVKWQEKVTKIGEEKRMKDLQVGLSTLMAVASMGGGIYSATRGMGAVAGVMGLVAGASIINAIKANDESKALDAAMKEMTNVFAVSLEPQTLELEGRVYKLTGDVSSQMNQVKQIVSQVILAQN
jgi:hypothetical protein